MTDYKISVSDDGFFVTINTGEHTLVIAEKNSIQIRNEETNRLTTKDLGICIMKHFVGDGPDCFMRLRSNIDSMEEAIMLAVDMLPFLDTLSKNVSVEKAKKATALKDFVKGLK